MLSIVIPAYNEEKYLPNLLECIRKQDYRDYEIIVVDANSKDKTKSIATKFGCMVFSYKSAHRGPGMARNIGAKYAKGGMLIFLDADVEFGNGFLRQSLDEIQKRKLDVAGYFIHPLRGNITDSVFFGIYNAWIWGCQFFYPHATGNGIFCRKSIHEKIKGFDETIRLAEDMDYVNRAKKHGRFRLIKDAKLMVSTRRFKSEGRIRVGMKIFLGAFHRLFLGEIRSDVFKYRFDYKK